MANYNAILDVSFVDGTVVEPLTLEAAKLYMKIDTVINEDNTLITTLITAARQAIERYANVSLIPRAVTAIICNLNGGQYLPYAPVTSAVVLTDKDANVITDAVLRGLTFKHLESPCSDNLKAVYNAGYTTSNIPAIYLAALQMQVLYMYENRGDLRVAPTVKTILSNARKL